jgi:ABC-type uncharacterized transport system permease subunit
MHRLTGRKFQETDMKKLLVYAFNAIQSSEEIHLAECECPTRSQHDAGLSCIVGLQPPSQEVRFFAADPSFCYESFLRKLYIQQSTSLEDCLETKFKAEDGGKLITGYGV